MRQHACEWNWKQKSADTERESREKLKLERAALSPRMRLECEVAKLPTVFRLDAGSLFPPPPPTRDEGDCDP